jgi:hypothetical protein
VIHQSLTLKNKKMKKNLGSVEKVIRLLIAVVFVVLYITGVVTGIFGYILLALAAIAIITSLFSFCPLWAIFGINTCKVKS